MFDRGEFEADTGGGGPERFNEQLDELLDALGPLVTIDPPEQFLYKLNRSKGAVPITKKITAAERVFRNHRESVQGRAREVRAAIQTAIGKCEDELKFEKPLAESEGMLDTHIRLNTGLSGTFQKRDSGYFAMCRELISSLEFLKDAIGQ